MKYEVGGLGWSRGNRVSSGVRENPVLRMARRAVDLEDRLVTFAAQVVAVSRRFPRNPVGKQVVSQLTRCATSAFANYAESRGAESRRDFVHKLRICLKELRESLSWIKFVETAGLYAGHDLQDVKRESDELVAILVASVRTAERRMK